MTSPKEKQVLAHLKAWLLQGKEVTSNEALRMWRTNRISEYVRRLRATGMNIETIMHYNGCESYGSYKLIIPKKKKLNF